MRIGILNSIEIPTLIGIPSPIGIPILIGFPTPTRILLFIAIHTLTADQDQPGVGETRLRKLCTTTISAPASLENPCGAMTPSIRAGGFQSLPKRPIAGDQRRKGHGKRQLDGGDGRSRRSEKPLAGEPKP